MQSETITLFEKELKRIKKPLVLRIEKWIQKYPLFSILISALTAIFINILANYLWELFKAM